MAIRDTTGTTPPRYPIEPSHGYLFAAPNKPFSRVLDLSLLFSVLLLFGAGLLSLLITFAVERRADVLGLVQAPNARSSHTRPTPRGGGLGIAAGGIAATLVLAIFGVLSLWAILPILTIMAALGFMDDLKSLRASTRLAIQLAAFGFMVWWTNDLLPIPLLGGLALGGALLGIIVVICGVWWLNLFNFMDGIDGIAASQGVLILIGAALLWLLGSAGATSDALWWWLLALATASSGFLLRNWPPAKIFMGDAGSYFLATAIFAAALLTIRNGVVSYASWLILVSVFVADASLTLTRRVLRGEKPFEAHKRHAYQTLSRCFGNHIMTTLLFAALTMFWAFPLALAAQFQPAYQWALVLISYFPLLIFMAAAGAGAQQVG